MILIFFKLYLLKLCWSILYFGNSNDDYQLSTFTYLKIQVFQMSPQAIRKQWLKIMKNSPEESKNWKHGPNYYIWENLSNSEIHQIGIKHSLHVQNIIGHHCLNFARFNLVFTRILMLKSPTNIKSMVSKLFSTSPDPTMKSEFRFYQFSWFVSNNSGCFKSRNLEFAVRSGE